MLAAAARLARGRRLAAPAPAVAGPARRGRRDRLVAGLARLRQRAGQKGGELTGPNPTDRGKPGAKRHLIVEGRGVPLAILQSPADRHDSAVFEALVDAVPPIKRPSGQRRKRPAKLHADEGYDYPRRRAALRRRRVKSRIARRGAERSDRLGRHRRVVERTLAWLNRFRRLTVRSERRADIHQAFLLLGCSLICLRRLEGRL